MVPPPSLPEPLFKGPVTMDTLRDSLAFRNIGSLKSEVSVKVTRGGERLGTFKGIFAYRSPGSMRLRLLSPMGVTAVEVLMSGDLLQLHMTPKKILYEGDAPDIAMPREAFYGMEVERESYILYAFKPRKGVMELTGKYSFHPLTLKNTGITLYTGGSRFVGIMLGDYSGELPMYMRLSFFNGYVMELTFKAPEVGADVPEKYFAPINGSGKTVLPLRALFGEPGKSR